MTTAVEEPKTVTSAREADPNPGRSRKVVIRRAGSYEQLTFEEQTVALPGPGEVAIDVRAIGINYADVMVRMGLYASAKELVGWPITPGFEVSGVVTALGEGVTDLEVGAEVAAVTLFNGYSTRVVVGRPYVFRKPKALSFEQMAGIPAVFMTAWYALFELAHPRPGQTVLIHSAAGGVGGSLVQMAKMVGCEVVGVVGGTHKIETARALGCEHVIDKSKAPLWGEAERLAPGGYDHVFDANGVATLKESYAHLRPAGKLVVYGFHTMIPKTGGRPSWPKLIWGFLRTPRFNPLEMTQNSKSVLCFNLSYLFDRTEMLELFVRDLDGWLADGRLQPPPITTYPFDDVARAHADIESGQTVGKLVLVP